VAKGGGRGEEEKEKRDSHVYFEIFGRKWLLVASMCQVLEEEERERGKKGRRGEKKGRAATVPENAHLFS